MGPEAEPPPAAPTHRKRPSLFWRIFLPNAAALLFAWAVLAFSPAKLASPSVAPLEFAAGLAGLLIIFLVNVAVLRRALSPLDRLRGLMRTADPLRPGRRIPVYGDTAEVVELTEAFNEMLARLERERRESSSRVFEALESDRLRLSRELHDEIGQELTALLLELDNASRDMPAESAAAVHAARESARHALEEVRRVARQLRPEVLDDLGLRSALINLADRMSGQTGVEIVRTIGSDQPPLAPEEELALYRIAQEGLTNAVRHSGARRIELRMERQDDRLVLLVRDQGAGLGAAGEGAGLTGMRERALMIGADLSVGPGDGGGFEVRLTLNLRASSPSRVREPA
jgi:two-component system, NarL family, sensor histidine kinase UhpB